MKSFLFNFVMGSGVVMLLVAAVLSTSPATYFYCLLREDEWLAAETRSELEGNLGFFTTREVMVEEDGKQKIRYLVFDREPLVVSYDHEEKIESIFFEYE